MRRTIALATLILGISACGGSSNGYSTGTTTTGNNNPAPTTANTINANDALVFNPASLSVTTGTTVTFNFQSIAHDVVFSAGTGSPGDIGSAYSTSKTVTFNTAGTFAFHCSIHPTMTGVVTVHS